MLSRPEDQQSLKNQVITRESTSETTTLKAAISRHIEKERVSFHIPGHKGRIRFDLSERFLSYDLTELPGLDDLSNPSGVLADLERRTAKIWGVHSSILSVSGATGALIATMIMLARRGSHVLVPRNCHRSIVNALVLTGLEPIWYEPVWEEAWGVWGPVTGNIIASALKASRQENLAGVVVVSPSYVGAISELKKIASVCHENGLPLLVDEADGAHCLLPETAELSALNCGADLVVHSLHKTIGALTQTGVAHISKGGAASFSFTPEELRTTLNLVQSSSPSYIFLSSIDERISALESGECAAELRELERLGQILRRHVKQLKHISVYEPIFGALNSGVMLGCPNIDALDELLMQQGIYSEIIVRPGLLLLLGIGSNENDVNFLLQALKEFDKSLTPNPGNAAGSPPSNRPEPIEQVLSPRQAFYMPSRVVSVAEAIGEIAVECVAPCPPGWPVTIPGQKIKASQLRGLNLPSVRVVVQPS